MKTETTVVAKLAKVKKVNSLKTLSNQLEDSEIVRKVIKRKASNIYEPKAESIMSPILDGELNVVEWGYAFTNDGSILKHINEIAPNLNRAVSVKHKDRMAQSIRKIGMSGGIAVVIYKGVYYIVDGNHRAAAKTDLGLPIYFRYRNVDTLDELIECVIQHNASAKNWVNDVYINTFSGLGRKPYIITKEFVIKYGFTPSTTVAIIGKISVMLAKVRIKDGLLNIESRAVAQDRIDIVNKFILRFGMGKGQRLVEGLIQAMNNIGYESLRANINRIADKAKELYTEEGYLKPIASPTQKDWESLFLIANRKIN